MGPASIYLRQRRPRPGRAVVGFVFGTEGFARTDIDTNQSHPAYSLAVSEKKRVPW
jgi:hypothetical protein